MKTGSDEIKGKDREPREEAFYKGFATVPLDC
jgi:hypothetical protein